MSKQCRPWIAMLLVPLALACGQAAAGENAPAGLTTLTVGAEQVRIYRNEFGVPHIFAETNRGLFEAYGYVVAQDRLWQLELNRRAARGRLSEIFGAGSLPSDRLARVTGYTDAELDEQFARQPLEIQEIVRSYGEGINRYLTEVIAVDPLKLPFEFYALGFTPAPWTTRDSTAFGAFMVRRFGEIGGREPTNYSVLAALQSTWGPAVGYQIFNDVRWINDPDSPVTVPTDGAYGKRQKSLPPGKLAAQSFQGALKLSVSEDEARKVWESLGVPPKLGSYGWVVSAARSAEGFAMLYGGPQMGFSAPEVVHEVQLSGGNGFRVKGMAFAGVPLVLIGRNDHVAWTSTTATGDNVDTYVETPCDAGGGPGSGYVYVGVCRPFDVRVETITVRGASAVSLTVARSVHGPVVGSLGASPVTQKRAHWMRETETTEAFLGFNRARNLNEFKAAAYKVVTSHNFFYADSRGNIAYWQTGQVPIRPEGFDTRLPLPGDGSAEWPGGILPVPESINPAQGYLANWNNKPSVGYDNADNQVFGKQFRLLDIQDRLATGLISLEDMRDIPKDIARVKGLGREARYLKPYLLEAFAAYPPANPLVAQARAVVAGWDGNAFADALASDKLYAGEVLFSAWLSRAVRNTFVDELGSVVNEANSNTLLHALDQALGGGSGVPPSRDYFNGVDPKLVLSSSFEQTVAALGPDPSVWSNQPRGVINFNHPLLGTLATIPNSNRATYAQIVVMGRPRATAENIYGMGQSGFVQFVPPGGYALDDHYRDQNPLFRNFEYKSMPLYLNTQLKE
jgi:penicillin amidase